MKPTRILCVSLGLLACEPPEPCPVGDDLGAWQLHTNTLVKKVDIPLDRCRRQPELRAEMLPGGRVSASRMFSLSSASAVRLDSGSPAGPCSWPSVRVDAEAFLAGSARFALKPGPHVAEVAAEVPADGRACVARLSPTLEVLP
jgi:hypothetical protein